MVTIPAAAHDDCVSLSDLRAEAEAILAEGVRSRKSPWRCLSVATISPDGHPEVRHVVLRGFDPVARTLRFHTDIRSPKWEELTRNPRVSVVGYDPGQQLQVRLRGLATCHYQDATAQTAWETSHVMSRSCYAAPHAPGTPLAVAPPAPRDCESGQAHFGAVVIAYNAMDVLKLASAGHHRAHFAWADGAYQETWLAP